MNLQMYQTFDDNWQALETLIIVNNSNYRYKINSLIRTQKTQGGLHPCVVKMFMCLYILLYIKKYVLQ